MLSMVVAIPSVFALVVWRSYRTEAVRAARGEPVTTPGALRWETTHAAAPGGGAKEG